MARWTHALRAGLAGLALAASGTVIAQDARPARVGPAGTPHDPSSASAMPSMTMPPPLPPGSMPPLGHAADRAAAPAPAPATNRARTRRLRAHRARAQPHPQAGRRPDRGDPQPLASGGSLPQPDRRLRTGADRDAGLSDPDLVGDRDERPGNPRRARRRFRSAGDRHRGQAPAQPGQVRRGGATPPAGRRKPSACAS